MRHSGRRKAWLLGAAVACVLAVFALRPVHSARQKSPTFDEPFHIAGGLTYWRHNDYRLHPENGVLARRIIALPDSLDREPFRRHPREVRGAVAAVAADGRV